VNEPFDVHNDNDASNEPQHICSSTAVASETSREQTNEQQGVMENTGSIWNNISGLSCLHNLGHNPTKYPGTEFLCVYMQEEHLQPPSP